jgi:ferredoxin, 2Fe-2S
MTGEFRSEESEMLTGRAADRLTIAQISSDATCELHVQDERGTHLVIGMVGEAVLAALQSHAIAIGAVCGGNMICGTCHVRLLTEDRSELPAPAPDELELLRLSRYFEPERSRLACQMRMHRSIHGLRLEVAPED